MRTQEAAIKTRAVTFQPRRSAGPRLEHSGGREAGVPNGQESPLPRPLSSAGPAPACAGQCPPQEKKQAEEASTGLATARPH